MDFMNILAYMNPVVVSIVVGLVIGAFVLALFGKQLAFWITARGNTPQASSAAAQPPAVVLPAPRPRLAGLSWLIATAHQSTSQFIGLIMSFSSLIAIILSVICAVAGIAIISYQQYGNIVLSATAAFATLILATIIENISLNALKNIRLASEEIALAEQAHWQQIVKQMEEQFLEDAQDFAKINQQTLSKEEVAALKRAASLKLQARKQFERKRHTLMRQQTRTARRTRNTSIPFAVVGVVFSASAGGLFWHTVLASLDLWLNLTVGTMFALAVSVTFVQSELFKRIKDEAISEALRSAEMQNVMLKQQSEEMVLELVVDSMAAVKQDPQTLIEMGTGIKEELKTTIKALTQQTTSRLIENTDNQTDSTANEEVQIEASVEQKVPAKRQRKQPEWWSHPALSMVVKLHPKMHLKLASWKSTGRVSVSIDAAINTLIEVTGLSRRTIQNRIKDGTLRATSHNSKLLLISSIIEWLQSVEPVIDESGTRPQLSIVNQASHSENGDEQRLSDLLTSATTPKYWTQEENHTEPLPTSNGHAGLPKQTAKLDEYPEVLV